MGLKDWSGGSQREMQGNAKEKERLWIEGWDDKRRVRE